MALEDVLAGLPVRGEYLAQQQFDQRQAIGLMSLLRSRQIAQAQQQELAQQAEMHPLRLDLLKAQVARQNEDMRMRSALDQRQQDALIGVEWYLKHKYPGTPAQMDAADNVMTPERQAPEVGLFRAAAALDPRNAVDMALQLSGVGKTGGRGADTMLSKHREDHELLLKRAGEARTAGNNALADSLEKYAALVFKRMEYEASGQDRYDRTENRRDAEFTDRTGSAPQSVPRPAPAATPAPTPTPAPTFGITRYTAQADSSLEGAMAATMDRLARARQTGDQEGVTRETQNIAKLRNMATPVNPSDLTKTNPVQRGTPELQTIPAGPRLAPKDLREIEREAIKTGNREVFDSISKSYGTLADAPNQIAMLNKARELIPQAAPFVGSFGEQKANIAQFFNNNFGTSIAAEQVANAGALRTALFTQIMDNLKKMDAQPSQLQQQMMMKALGDLNTDPGAMNKIVDIMDEVVRTKVDTHNKRIPADLPRGDVFKIELPGRVAAPERSGGGLPRVQSQADYDRIPRGGQFIHPDGSTRTKR